jgi:uncharacterized protein YuzE
MRAKVAVATIQGKAYYLIVNELKRRQIPFVSLIPGDSVSAEIRAVITTKQEKRFILHPKTVTYDPETDPEILGAEIVRILRGREIYENIVIGVDPGDVFGVQCWRMRQLLIRKIATAYEEQSTTSKTRCAQ